MTSLIFLLTALTLLVLFIRTIIKLARRKPVWRIITVICIVVVVYGLAWTVFKSTQKLAPAPMGTQVCFDDWCATVTRAERQDAGDSSLIILHIKMFNNARGIAQTPSEPRVHILDPDGHAWPFSLKAQAAYEKRYGTQPGIAHRLELHQSMETVMVFALPRGITNLQALIEEGPWITNLLFPEDEMVFNLENK